jgi:hypothetical protein
MSPAKFQVCVLNYSSGFREVAEAIHYGLLEAGYDSVLTGIYQIRKFPDRRKVIFASQLGKFLRRRFPEIDWREIIRDDDIVYNAGQLREELIDAQETDEILRERVIWDFSARNVEFLQRRGCRQATLVPLGTVSELQRIPRREYDADVMFYGVANIRRSAVLDRLKASGLRCRFFDQRSPIWGEERDDLIGRTKIILNIHFYEYKIFEILRAFYPLMNGKCLVSENGLDMNELLYRDAAVFCDYDRLVETCVRIAADDTLLHAQEERAINSMSSLRQSDILLRVLHANP